jgi:hypothetical protein
MAPLMCASVSDMYGDDFGLTADQIAKRQMEKNKQCAIKNEQYQQNLYQTEIGGKANFVPAPNTIGPVGPNGPNGPAEVNKSEFANRMGYANINQTWPPNNNSMFNRFQIPHREFYSEKDALQHIVKLLEEGLIIGKLILLVLVLLFLIKLLDKK